MKRDLSSIGNLAASFDAAMSHAFAIETGNISCTAKGLMHGIAADRAHAIAWHVFAETGNEP